MCIRDRTKTKTKTHTKCLKTQHMLYFWNPHDLLIPNMMMDTSPWPSCSSQSPWLPCSGHTISSTGLSVSPFRDFYKCKRVPWCYTTRACIWNVLAAVCSHTIHIHSDISCYILTHLKSGISIINDKLRHWGSSFELEVSKFFFPSQLDQCFKRCDD